MKIALVTGANKGIGREVARQLAAKGFHVFIGARNRSAGRKAADEIAKKGGKTAFLEIDVSDNNSVAVAAREFVKTSDHLDVLVNNAGIIVDGDHAILEIGDELLRKTLETNTLGALRVIRAFVPLLAKSKAPRVINVSSGGGQLTGGADGWSPAYCISKTALNGVTSQEPPHCRSLRSILFARAGCAQTWAEATRRAQSRKARIRLCGWPSMRRRRLPANSCVIAKKFRGDPPSPRLRRAGLFWSAATC